MGPENGESLSLRLSILAVTVSSSSDGGASWRRLDKVWPGFSGYSTMAALPSGELGLMYERAPTRFDGSVAFWKGPFV